MVSDSKKENNYWFRPKRYGYGLRPISWQGWLASLFLTALIILSAYLNNFFDQEPSSADVWRYLLSVTILIIIFMRLAVPKTKGRMKWNWGEIEEEEENND